MRPLKPSYREKRRWVLVKFLKGRPDSPKKWAVRKLLRMLGSWGFAMAVRRVEERGEGLLLEVSRDWVYVVRAALVLGREDFIPHTVVSGSVKALRRKGFITD